MESNRIPPNQEINIFCYIITSSRSSASYHTIVSIECTSEPFKFVIIELKYKVTQFHFSIPELKTLVCRIHVLRNSRTLSEEDMFDYFFKTS